MHANRACGNGRITMNQIAGTAVLDVFLGSIPAMAFLDSLGVQCRRDDNIVNTRDIYSESADDGAPSRFMRRACREVNRPLPLLCVPDLAAPQHWNYCNAICSSIFISTMRPLSKAESKIQGDYPCCSRSSA